MGCVHQIQARPRLGERAQRVLDRLGFSRPVYGLGELLPVRLHHTEVNLSGHSRSRLSAEEERDAEERIAEIERTHEVRGARELTVVGSPVVEVNSEHFDAEWSTGAKQPAKGVGSANEPVAAGRRRGGQQTTDPLSEHGPPWCLGHLCAKENDPVCEPISGSEYLWPAFRRNGRTGGRHCIEPSSVSACPCYDVVVASQSDECLGGHRSVIASAPARHFAPSSS